MRSFISIDIHESVKENLTRCISEMSPMFPEFTFVPAENLHITLAFLGDVEQATVPKIINCLHNVSACHKPFTLSLGQPGAFVNRGDTRILYMGLNCGYNQLNSLARKLRQGLALLGFADNKSFRSHITLGRKRRRVLTQTANAAQLWKDGFFSLMRERGNTEECSWSVRNIFLMESRLVSPAPEYKVIHRVSLG